MAKEMSLFGGKGNSLISKELLDQIRGIDKNLMGGGGSGLRRISMRGSRFRQIVGGEQIAVSQSSSMNVVIVDAAPISRMYYEGVYDPDKVVPPTCWSSDTKTPDESVPDDQRQSDRCATCPMDVKGSGKGESRACRFSQRLAVVLENKYDEVYQISLAATSLFGDAVGNNMPMGAYARYLSGHNTPSISIVTEMYFDEDSDVPKLFFRPVRPLEEEELKLCLAANKSDDAKRAVELTVSQTDGVQPLPKPAAAEEEEENEDEAPQPKAKTRRGRPPKAKVEEEEEDEDEVEPPKKATRTKAKPAPEPEEGDDDEMESLLSDWDD